MNKGVMALVALLIAFVLVSQSMFIIEQTEQAIVLQFGKPKQVHKEAGLKFKIPFIQEVTYYDNRVLDLMSPPQQVILSDQKRIDVNAYARFQIIDPLAFYRTVANEVRVKDRLSNTMNASLRRVLGKVTLSKILSAERTYIIESIRLEMTKEAKELGVKIFDVRIIRADLPEQTSQSIFNRMRSEREREASEFRAQGVEQSQQIRARADREKVTMQSKAKMESETIKGKADAEASITYAKAYAEDPEFYGLYRSYQAYKEAFAVGGTFFMSPDHDFLKYLKKSKP
jgi:modulator of FtsH protease HflC